MCSPVTPVSVNECHLLPSSPPRLLQRQRKENPELSLNSCLSKALGEVAPSITLTALSESAAFLLGAISNMPAVRTFSLFAGTAVLLNFLFQVREEGGRGGEE